MTGKPKHQIQKYDRHSTAPINSIFAQIKAAREAFQPSGFKIFDTSTVKIGVNGQVVNSTSLRLRTFLEKGTKCFCCGLEATHFAVERDLATASRNGGYHLNLWGVKDGEEVLFTHDHILARALGGKDQIENTQTACCYCNWEKGSREQIEAQQRKAKPC